MTKRNTVEVMYLFWISLLALVLTLFIYAIPNTTGEKREVISSVATSTLQVIETKPFNPKDFKCRFVQEINFCTQRFTQKVGETNVMGEYNSLLNTIFIRLTDDKNANIGRLQHEVTHYMLYKYTAVYTAKQIRIVAINEKIAYETQGLFEQLLNYLD